MAQQNVYTRQDFNPDEYTHFKTGEGVGIQCSKKYFNVDVLNHFGPRWGPLGSILCVYVV